MEESFLDTNIIFNYSNYVQGKSKKILEKCYFFIKNKKGKFILCYAVIEELDKIISKRANIHKAVINKIKDSNYSLEDTLPSRDVPFAKKLYEQFKEKDPEEVSIDFANQRHLSETKIEKFLKTKVDEKVVSLEKIDKELVKKIHDIISNHADCKVLASALQTQGGRETFLFVTVDGEDFDPNGYDFLKEHFEINYPNEQYKFPKLRNLLFEN